MLKQRRSLSASTVQLAADVCANHLNTFAPFVAASAIAAYVASQNELNLTPVIQGCWASGKTVLLPRIDDFVAHRMVFAELAATDTLVANRYGLYEPNTACAISTDIPVMLVPLVASDVAGNRIGMGGGYYDRYLSQYGEDTVKIGMAYDWQVVSSINAEPWDIPLDYLCTPLGVIACN